MFDTSLAWVAGSNWFKAKPYPSVRREIRLSVSTRSRNDVGVGRIHPGEVTAIDDLMPAVRQYALEEVSI